MTGAGRWVQVAGNRTRGVRANPVEQKFDMAAE
jgi:hypothetical protein